MCVVDFCNEESKNVAMAGYIRGYIRSYMYPYKLNFTAGNSVLNCKDN